MMAQNGGFVLSGKHVLIGVLAMFGVIVAVNLVFVYLAIDTFTGVTRENPYQEGLAYNKVLEARETLRDLGWRGDVSFTKVSSGEDSITVTLTDGEGGPLSGLDLEGSLRRPTHEGMDQELNWREESPGAYSAVVTLPRRGNWDLEITADDGSNPPFEMKTRLWLK
ncbi:FixH family protein [Pelagibius marinus]|uniref:FixH family protein n=1 Tax=Pelagibius marinus TaxID=2762760 RepID=UPI0018728CBA|nr:FixH family protein [Pelagibius marinus]